MAFLRGREASSPLSRAHSIQASLDLSHFNDFTGLDREVHGHGPYWLLAASRVNEQCRADTMGFIDPRQVIDAL